MGVYGNVIGGTRRNLTREIKDELQIEKSNVNQLFAEKCRDAVTFADVYDSTTGPTSLWQTYTRTPVE